MKKYLIAAMFALMSSGAYASTTDCGVIDDGIDSDCGGLQLNLAVHDTTFRIEAETGTEEVDDISGINGSLSILTYVDPFFSTATSTANILLEVFGVGSANLTYGGVTQALVFSGGQGTSLVTDQAMVVVFSGAGLSFGETLTLDWAGLDGTDQISIRVSAVPLPASAFLLIGGLGGLIAMRRRKKVP